MTDIKEKVIYNDNDSSLTVVRQQDVEPYLQHNADLRASRSEHQKYKGSFVLAASIPSIVVEQMRNGQCCADSRRYDLLSPDNDERRRALMHVQSVHNHLLAVNGKPFAKQRVKWQ